MSKGVNSLSYLKSSSKFQEGEDNDLSFEAQTATVLLF
jgi:hypothetical protein